MGSYGPRARQEPAHRPGSGRDAARHGPARHDAGGGVRPPRRAHPQGAQRPERDDHAGRRHPPARQELRRGGATSPRRAHAGQGDVLPARRAQRRAARGRGRPRARADEGPRGRQVRQGARLRRRPADAARRLRGRHAVRRRRQAARLDADDVGILEDLARLGADRDRDARRHRGAQAGRVRPPALDRAPARADGQQPDRDLRQGPRGPLPVPQPRRRAPARHHRGGGDRQDRRRAAPARARRRAARARRRGGRGRRAARDRGDARPGRPHHGLPLGEVPAHRPRRRAVRHLRHLHRHHRAQADRGGAARGAAALRQRVRERADRDGDGRHRRPLPPGQRGALRADRAAPRRSC